MEVMGVENLDELEHEAKKRVTNVQMAEDMDDEVARRHQEPQRVESH